MDNRLAHMDQASFLALRALGQGALLQVNWIHSRSVNVDGLPFARIRGQLLVVSGRVHGKVWIAANAYLPGRTNSQDALREDLSGTFAEFNVTVEIQG